jgi:hypothetical protein
MTTNFAASPINCGSRRCWSRAWTAPAARCSTCACRPAPASCWAGRRTDTWGANGAYLGPTIRAARGDRVLMNVSNELPEATTIHWHGMHLPAAADGGPH